MTIPRAVSLTPMRASTLPSLMARSLSTNPKTVTLTVSGIKTANVTASDSISLSVPVVLVKNLDPHHARYT